MNAKVKWRSIISASSKDLVHAILRAKESHSKYLSSQSHSREQKDFLSESKPSLFDVGWVVFVCVTHSQVTQEICDPSRVFRLLGSDRLVLLFSAHWHIFAWSLWAWRAAGETGRLPAVRPSVSICCGPAGVFKAAVPQVLSPGNWEVSRRAWSVSCCHWLPFGI